MYTLNDFDFALPAGLIAQTPARPRDHARLLVYNRTTRQIIDDHFYNLSQYLPANTTLVLNNSKVEKCRLRFPGESGVFEIFVVETVNNTTLRALVRPGKKFKLNAHVELSGGAEAHVTDISPEGLRTLVLNKPLDDPAFDEFRLTPLPPYIVQDESLASEYQTVYAKPLGSKASPTAGLHFTSEMLAALRQKHDIAEVTLHVGLGTFAPVKSDNLTDHVMHEEWFSINAATAAQLNSAKHITAVGTTSVRTLESASHPFVAESSSTTIFITPGYDFAKIDALITNFHLPKSTLLMLVSAFLGTDGLAGRVDAVEELHRIYAYAISGGYRFYSFGDAMLIL